MEEIRPFIRQYFVESDTDGAPVTMNTGKFSDRCYWTPEVGNRQGQVK